MCLWSLQKKPEGQKWNEPVEVSAAALKIRAGAEVGHLGKDDGILTDNTKTSHEGTDTNTGSCRS